MDGVKRDVPESEIEWARKCGYVFCTEIAPMREGRAIHPDAERIGLPDDQAFSAGNKETYKCPYCGLVFEVTQPDY